MLLVGKPQEREDCSRGQCDKKGDMCTKVCILHSFCAKDNQNAGPSVRYALVWLTGGYKCMGMRNLLSRHGTIRVTCVQEQKAPLLCKRNLP